MTNKYHLVLEMLNDTYSQLDQDITVVKFFKGKRNGYFIEIGANDGITLSNTYLLEKKYDWKGICIEPLPEKFIAMKQNRPGSLCINKAIFHTSDLNLQFSSCDLLSGITEYIDKYLNVKESEQITVKTIRLDEVLTQAQAPSFIEYLSIDTEGTELKILKTIDFKKYTFGIIDIEHNYIEPRRTMMRELLVSNGYHYKGENNWDDSYIHASLI